METEHRCECGSRISKNSRGKYPPMCRSCIVKARIKQQIDKRNGISPKPIYKKSCPVCGVEISYQKQMCDPCKAKKMKEDHAARHERYLASLGDKREEVEDMEIEQNRVNLVDRCHAIMQSIGMTPNAIRHQYKRILCDGKQIHGTMKIFVARQ